MQYSTPILFLIFNRPEVTFSVFERIRDVQPLYLFIAADGPRSSKPEEAELCKQTRSIVEKIDWPCVVKTLFRDENIGCAKGVSSAITWFFEQVEHGIILEDDCFPDLTFFSFCEQLLVKYNDDKEIGSICGFNNHWVYLEIDTVIILHAFTHRGDGPPGPTDGKSIMKFQINQNFMY